MKAYRKHVQEDTPAPVLLWRVTPFDGWALLDGHDRAVAALAEGRTPPCVVLYRAPDDEDWRRTADELTEAHEQRMRQFAERPQTPERQRAVLETAYEDTLSSLPYDEAPTLTWPLPGGAPTWDDLAARAVFECPRD